MNNDRFISNMHSEIEKRLHSDSWNLEISSKVLKKKKKKNLMIFSSSIGTFAAVAATVMFILTSGFNTGTSTNVYYSFISKQVEGTYNNVFKKDNNNSSAEIYSSDIDSTIDETLSMR